MSGMMDLESAAKSVKFRQVRTATDNYVAAVVKSANERITFSSGRFESGDPASKFCKEFGFLGFANVNGFGGKVPHKPDITELEAEGNMFFESPAGQ
jgi:hypothetical protein